MAFSQVGSVITQTGTDTDLSGLSGLTGVSVISYSSRYDIYNIGTNRLDIEGDLTINPENNMLISNAPTAAIPNMAVNVRANATLTLGVKTTVGTAVKYTTGTAMILTEPGTLNSDGSLHVEYDGTLEAFGATIQMAGPTRLRSGAYFTCEDLTLVNCRDASCQFRIEANNATDTARVSVTENGMTLNGDTNNDSCRLTTTGKAAFPSNAFVFNFIRAQYQPSASGYPSQVFLNFDNGNNVDASDFAYAGTGGVGIQFDGNLVDFRNVARRLRYRQANSKGGFCKTTKNVNFILRDASGTGLSTISYYAVDVDNGNRINSFNGFDSTADIVYSGQNAGPTLAITATVEFMAGQDTTRFIDSRTNADDTILFRFISYTTNITSTSPVLIGLKDLDSVVVNATDALVSESNRTTVDAYAELETSAKFYDRAKSYLTANYAGEAATLVTRSGSAIDADAFDIVIDATAASAFALSGNTITIKASEFVGDITTTGTITLSNGATFIGSFTDSNGTTTITTLTLTGLQPNSEVRVFNTGTITEVAGVENSGTSFTANISASSVDIVVHSLGYLNQRIENLATTNDTTLPITQIVDRQYDNP